jgi:hypothetical protein
MIQPNNISRNYVLKRADERMSRSKSGRDFNVKTRHGYVWFDARSSLRAEHRTE